jgi:wobble nucleotide-excising tRNase
LRLKGQKVNDWITQATKMLKCFKLPTIETNSQLKGTTKLILIQLIEHPKEINELKSKSSRSKYRKLIKKYNGFNTDVQELALDELNKRIPELNKELLDFDSRLITQLFSID